MKQVLAVGMLLFSGAMLEAQNLQPPTSSSPLSTQVVVARASTNTPGTEAAGGTGAFSETVATATPNPLLAVVPQVAKSVHRSEPSEREIRIWRGLLAAEHSAAIFDAMTTRDSVASGNGYERNPLVRPFASSAAIYPALQVAPVGLDFLSHYMMRSRSSLLRKTWWLPQVASITASLWCGSRNIHVADLHH
jgi:hypothetical protein